MGKKGGAARRDRNDPWASEAHGSLSQTNADSQEVAKTIGALQAVGDPDEEGTGRRRGRRGRCRTDSGDRVVNARQDSEGEGDLQLQQAIQASLMKSEEFSTAEGWARNESGHNLEGGHASDEESKVPDRKKKGKRSVVCAGGVRAAEPYRNEKQNEVFGLQCHHGKYVRFESDGSVKGTSSKIGDMEKFELVHHQGASHSLKTLSGKYLAAEKTGEVKALRSEVGDSETFELCRNPDGTVSFKSFFGHYIAAVKGGLQANRGMAGAWEKFELKARGQKKVCRDTAEVPEGDSSCVKPACILFDACCDLEAVLFAEERYAATHADKTAIEFDKRARTRRANGLALSFEHFCKEHSYSASFGGCVSMWDVTIARAPSEQPAEFEEQECWATTGLNWQTIIKDAQRSSGRVSRDIYACFGIPCASAAEADCCTFDRLEELCRLPCCVAIGPIGLDFTPVQHLICRPEHRDLSFLGIAATFGVLPRATAYDPTRDPEHLAWLECSPGLKAESWILQHGDRRQCEFEAANADHARRNFDVQASVVERQLLLARKLNLPLIVQLPPQDAAERKMAELLLAGLGGEGAEHPILLSSFRGRPKCAAMLLKAFPALVVGFSGLITHKKLGSVLGEVAFDIPASRLVLESLGPMYPPSSAVGSNSRGSYSHPLHVADVAVELARIKGISTEEVLEVALQNVTSLFRFSDRCDSPPVKDPQTDGTCDATSAILACAEELTER